MAIEAALSIHPHYDPTKGITKGSLNAALFLCLHRPKDLLLISPTKKGKKNKAASATTQAASNNNAKELRRA